MRWFNLFVACLTVSSVARADIPIFVDRIATGLSNPLFVTSAPGDPNRIYIVEQSGSQGVVSWGAIRIYDLTTHTLEPTPFLTVTNLASSGEQGLLGLAFSPDYVTSGKLYTNSTVFGSGATEIHRYTRNSANTADPASAQTILTFSQPQANHNGGWLGFGPNDGDLYISTGDGGNADDMGPGHNPTIGNAQDKTTLLGKMLRIDVTSDPDDGLNYKIPANNPFAGATDSTRKEIWSYGLRNPWRNSFDRANGNLYIGDVGQNQREEIDFQPASSSGGENYGWNAKEGTRVTGFQPIPPGVVDPIHEYTHADGIAVTGGYVYRGSENEQLQGTYIFGDYGSTKIWSFKYDGTTKTNFKQINSDLIFRTGGAINTISSFGEDAAGNLYLTDISDGEVYRLTPAFPGDADLNGFVDSNDLSLLAPHWQQMSGANWDEGDFNDDGRVDALDIYIMAGHWYQNGPSMNQALLANGLPLVVPEPAAASVVMMVIALRARPSRRRQPA